MKTGNFKYLLAWGATIVILLIVLTAVLGNVNSQKPEYYDIVKYFENIGTDEPSVKTFTLDSNNLLTIETTDNKQIEFRLQDREIFYQDCYSLVKAYNATAKENGLEEQWNEE